MWRHLWVRCQYKILCKTTNKDIYPAVQKYTNIADNIVVYIVMKFRAETLFFYCKNFERHLIDDARINHKKSSFKMFEFI